MSTPTRSRSVLFTRLVSSLVFLLAPLAATAEDRCPDLPTALDPALGSAVDRIVEDAVTDGFAGGVAIARDGVVVYDRVAGFADRRGKVPVTHATRFHVASISKYLTAILTVRTAAAGHIELDAPIAPWVPDTRLASRGVTWRDLLAHQSGLGSSYVGERIDAPETALAAIDAQPIDVDRVGGFRYSNDGYNLLAVLLERVHGTTYEAALRTEVLRPACLANTSAWAETELTDPQRVGQPLETLSRRLRRRNYGMLGASGMLTTARDLVQLALAIEQGHLLDPTAVEVLRAPRGAVSLGQATFGAFLIDHPTRGRVLSARGYESWGDNAILDHDLDRNIIIAVVTSKGPAESTGEAPFRTRISQAIGDLLARDAPPAP